MERSQFVKVITCKMVERRNSEIEIDLMAKIWTSGFGLIFLFRSLKKRLLKINSPLEVLLEDFFLFSILKFFGSYQEAEIFELKFF